MKIAESSVSMASGHRLETRTAVRTTTLEQSSGGLRIQDAAAVYARTEVSAAAVRESYGRQGVPGENAAYSPQTPGEKEPARTARQPLGNEAAHTPRETRGREPDSIPGQDRTAKLAGDWEDAERILQRMGMEGPELPDPRTLLEELRSQLLDRMIQILNGLRAVPAPQPGTLSHGTTLDLRGPAARAAGLRTQLFGGGVAGPVAHRLAFPCTGPGSPGSPAAGTSSGGTVWKRTSASFYSHEEYEETSFQSRGVVVTEDGRSIDFGVEFSLSRSVFQHSESLTTEQYILTDPLIINLKGDAPSVSNVKFRFDLDSDGTAEEIAFAGEGSGFLALDRNGNGSIDDGGELFGARSGDGFGELAEYDGDGNHWIDENDEVYSRLKVWTRDAAGHEKLIGLKEANVGAIYLGSVSTEFSLKDPETNETGAVVRRSGFYLRETGEAGTLSHVDLRQEGTVS